MALIEFNFGNVENQNLSDSTVMQKILLTLIISENDSFLKTN